MTTTHNNSGIEKLILGRYEASFIRLSNCRDKRINRKVRRHNGRLKKEFINAFIDNIMHSCSIYHSVTPKFYHRQVMEMVVSDKIKTFTKEPK